MNEHVIYQLCVSALSVMLLISGFCRLRKTNAHTYRLVRWGFAALTVAAVAVLWAQLVDPQSLSWAWLALLGGIVWVQAATAMHWEPGVPKHFQRTDVQVFPPIDQGADDVERRKTLRHLNPMVQAGCDLGNDLTEIQ